MGRSIKRDLPEVRKVHRFHPQSPLMLKYDDWSAFQKSGLGIQEGDVVRVPYASSNPEALVLNVFHERLRDGEYIPKYRVARRNKDGSWAKNWNYEFPGPVQRALADTYPEEKENAFVLANS